MASQLRSAAPSPSPRSGARRSTTPDTSAITADPRWAQLVARDATADGTFFYSVESTGVYCRPSCGARLPNPKNVRFHATLEAAERAGYRACKRCRPTQAAGAALAAKVTQACRLLEGPGAVPALPELAAAVGLSPSHFHRAFKAACGVTPRAYAAARRARRVSHELPRSRSVSAAIHQAGFNATSRFYEQSSALLGMTPSELRAGGLNQKIHFAVGQCSLGAILVAQSTRGVCSILLGDEPEQLVRDLEQRFARAELLGGDAEFEQLVARVVGFVEAPRLGLDLPLDVRGTAFQLRVWQALCAIPPGSTATYAEIAERIGAPRAVRAVGTACGRNPLAVAIPCHRVVRQNGDLSGFRWGIERKRSLLEREAQGASP